MSRIDLNALKIASPCTMSWDKMKGGDQVRHCGECKLNVYNLSKLSNDEAQDLLAKAAQGKRVCVRFLRRSDGTVITQDCPVGVKIARRMKLKLAALRLSISAAVFGIFGSPAFAASTKDSDGNVNHLMGKIEAPVPKTPPPKPQAKPPQTKPPKTKGAENKTNTENQEIMGAVPVSLEQPVKTIAPANSGSSKD